MREVKLRAWVKNRKTMYFGIGYKPTARGFSIMPAEYRNKLTRHGHYLAVKEIHSHMESISILRYTGLKDKNGVEIYEGDVLTCGNLNYKLTWEDGKACEIHNKEDKFSPRFLFNYINQLEVIGNIYENKELLDG